MRQPFPSVQGLHGAANQSRLALAPAPVLLPAGAVTPYAGDLTTAAVRQNIINQGWLPCDGTAYPQSRYQDLFHAIGLIYTPAGKDDGMFCVPDYSGQFLRGLASNAQQDPGFKSRAAPPQGTAQGVGSTQGCMVETHEHNFTALKDAAIAQEGTGGTVPPGTPTPTTGLLDSSGKTLSGEETRPKNIYVNFLIKAAGSVNALGVLR